jgi:hypothetical protein
MQQLIIDILSSNPNGLNHAEIVRKVREHGCDFQGNLSSVLHQTILSLIKDGVISKNFDTRIIQLQDSDTDLCCIS